MKPEHIKVDVLQKVLYLYWPDGKVQALSHQVLREQCPCGFCRAKRLRQQEIIAAADTTATATTITAMFDQGYGTQICFSDGHDKGIFPWTYLYEIQQAELLAYEPSS